VADNETPLAKVLEALRHELAQAWKDSQGQQIRFRASEVTLTVETVLKSDQEFSGGVRWYVLHAGGGASSGRESTQTIVLTLTPGLYDEHGHASPLDVTAQQREPGQ